MNIFHSTTIISVDLCDPVYFPLKIMPHLFNCDLEDTQFCLLNGDEIRVFESSS